MNVFGRAGEESTGTPLVFRLENGNGVRWAALSFPLPAESPPSYAFGLNRPSDPATPGVPDHLVLTAGGPGSF